MKNISVIKAKFKRLNIISECTKLFTEFDETQKQIINNNIDFLDNEESIFSFFLGIDYWWNVTNLRLIIFDNNTTFFIIFEEIKSLKLNEIFEQNHKKNECETLDINLINNEYIKLQVEKNSWHSVYNILHFLQK